MGSLATPSARPGHGPDGFIHRERKMYGTVAKMRVKPDKLDELKEAISGWTDRSGLPPGGVAVMTYQMDADPYEFFMTAVFESKETYVANAESPEQHKRYLQMMEFFEGEPEWHDGEIVFYQEF
jgi:quinol monooxygenase YgiN